MKTKILSILLLITAQIDLQDYSKGVYYLKFVFTHGYVVDKKIAVD